MRSFALRKPIVPLEPNQKTVYTLPRFLGRTLGTRIMNKKYLLLLATFLVSPCICFGFGIVGQFPSFDSHLVTTNTPLSVVFDDSLNASSVADASFYVTLRGDATHIPGAISFQTTYAADDTAVFTPSQLWGWGVRYQLHVTSDVESAGGDPFSGEPPLRGIFVANIPNDLQIAVYNPEDPFAVNVESNVLIGYDPLNPEADAEPWDIPGINATGAWKYSTGTPEILVAVIDDGISSYQNPDLRKAFFLNAGELPLPNIGGSPCSQYDCNEDGRFDVDDYAQDNRISGSPNVQKLIDAFSDGIDGDENGLIDDISGWDFLRNVNTVYGSYEIPSGTHGEGMFGDSLYAANNGYGGLPGACPNCRGVFIRGGASLIYDYNIFAAAVRYATSLGVKSINFSGANLQWSAEAHQAIEDALDAGIQVVAVAGDEMTYHHWFPSAGEDVLNIKALVPMASIDVGGLFNTDMFAFIESYCTNYGSHVFFALPSIWACSSDASGLSTGLIALLNSYAHRQGITLAPNEAVQLLRESAYDIKDRCVSVPDFFNVCKEGFDMHFGYGRPDVESAMVAIGDPDFDIEPTIPPQVAITSPEWWQTFDPEAQPNMDVYAKISSRTNPFQWELQIAKGPEPWDAEFQVVAGGSSSQPIDGLLGTVPISTLFPPDWASGTPTTPFAFDVTLRLQARYETAAKGQVMGEARKTFSVHSDNDSETGLMPGFPMNLRASGESSPVLYDLDGAPDQKLEIVMGLGDGSVIALKYSESSGAWENMPGFPVDCSGNDPFVKDSFFASVAIGDLFGTGTPQIVAATMLGKIYAIDPAGAALGSPFLPGFPAAADPSDNSDATAFGFGPGFIASPVLADLDGDGVLEIVAASQDQKVYAWKPVPDGAQKAQRMPGWPVTIRSEEGMVPSDKVCNGDISHHRILGTPAVGILDPSSPDLHISMYPSVIVNAGEVCSDSPVTTSRVYAIYHDGTEHEGGPFLPGWPVKVASPIGGALALDLTWGANGSPAVLVTEDGARIAAGAIAWFPQYIKYSDGIPESIDISILFTINMLGFPTFSSLRNDGSVQLVLPVTSPIRIDESGIHLINNRVVAMNIDPPHEQILQAEIEDIPMFMNPSVADMDNNGSREVLVGSGGYLAHAYSLDGGEATGWPKYTQKWNMTTPTIGDVDTDGLLEIVMHTREGYLYGWKSKGLPCPDDHPNSDWPKYHHDEHNSGFYGHDSTPPARVSDLTSQAAGDDFIRIDFTASGDDWRCGRAGSYDVRYSTETSADLSDAAQFEAATALAYPPLPSVPGGQVESLKLLAPGAAHIALRVIDDAGNLSRISNDATVSPPADDDTADDDTTDDDSVDDDTADDDTSDDDASDDDTTDDDATDDDAIDDDAAGDDDTGSSSPDSSSGKNGCGC